jgi:methionyl-tRNA formyltransferase
MNIAIIGRSQLLYRTAKMLLEKGHQISLIITSREAPEYTVTASDFEALATSIGAKYIYTPKIDLDKYSDQIKSAGAVEIAVSINYTGIISQEVINLFEKGILNAHAGDLPKYRGNAPLAWAIINKEKRVGLCIHKMIGGELDSGNILAKTYYDLNIDTRIGELFEWMETNIPSLMLNAIDKLQQDKTFAGEKQSVDPIDALRGYPRLPEDGKINWTQNNEDIVRLINASSEPFGGAFCSFENEPMTIWRASIYEDDEKYSAIPGQVASIQKDGSVVIITASGKIKITEITYKNKRTSPAEFIKSIRKRLT